ncbi:MAG TPA: hypothetical protein VF054_18270 [Micromonosporaceae bacterium]
MTGRAAVILTALFAVVPLTTSCSAQRAPVADSSAAPAATSAASSPQPAFPTCAPAQAEQIRVPVDGGILVVGMLGSGTRVVILSNQSDEDLCSWVPFANRLVGLGYRVALWNYDAGTSTDALTAIVTAVRQAGAQRIVLIGASKGAKASLIVGAHVTPPVQGVVSLSAEERIGNKPVAPELRTMSCPVLLVTAESAYADADAAKTFLATVPSHDRQLVSVPGSDHGTALLSGAQSGTVTAAIDRFLKRTLGAT